MPPKKFLQQVRVFFSGAASFSVFLSETFSGFGNHAHFVFSQMFLFLGNHFFT